MQLNPIPLPIVELQDQNIILKGKNKGFEKVIFGVIAAGTLLLIHYVAINAESRQKQ